MSRMLACVGSNLTAVFLGVWAHAGWWVKPSDGVMLVLVLAVWGVCLTTSIFAD